MMIENSPRETIASPTLKDGPALNPALLPASIPAKNVTSERDDNGADYWPNCAPQRKRVNRQTKTEEKQSAKEIAKGNNQVFDPFAMLSLPPLHCFEMCRSNEPREINWK
jgi:hypothetical protein